MNLVIFDIDGTLTKTLSVDEECYIQAFADEFELEGFSTDWGSYASYTDSGIAAEIFSNMTGRDLEADEHQRLIDRFLFLLSSRLNDNPELFGEIPGAALALAQIRQDDGWETAIATGCWLESARFKLRAAQIDFGGIPLATADDSMIRDRIFRIALKRARHYYNVKHFDRVVYVGDGFWDVKMCIQLKHPFVGISNQDKSWGLKNLGATCLLPDFSDYNRFRQALDEAQIPGTRK